MGYFLAVLLPLANKTWNKEHFVSDDVVKDDLEILSDGQLELHEGHNSLDTLAYSASKRDKEMQRLQQQQRKGYKQNGNKNRKNRNSGGGSGGGGGNYGYRKRK